MISLSVEDYCHTCPDFEPDCIVTELGTYTSDKTLIDTVIRCKHKDKCRSMNDRILDYYAKKEPKNEVDKPCNICSEYNHKLKCCNIR